MLITGTKTNVKNYVCFTFVDHFDRKRVSVECIECNLADVTTICNQKVVASAQSGKLTWRLMNRTEVRSWALGQIAKELGLTECLAGCNGIDKIIDAVAGHHKTLESVKAAASEGTNAAIGKNVKALINGKL